MSYFQRYNKRIGAWVKMEKLKNGRVVIKNVKQSNPKVEFKGVPKK
jgi:hypothetical protein